MQEYDPHRDEDVIDAPAALLNRLRLAAAQRGEGRLTGNAAKKILRGFSSEMTRARGEKRTRRTYDGAYDTRVLGGYTGPGRSARDPRSLGGIVDSMIAHRGWKEPVAVSSVLARWEDLMGPGLAQHARPEGYEDSTVTIRCDSTAWATQIKLMRGEILAMFARELGDGVVTQLVVRGPNAPSWKRGKLRAPGGRGPRDTYG